MRSRFLAPLCVLLVLADPLGATWSIVCVNSRTREVGVGTATCIPDISLISFVPVIQVGEGAAAAQSFIDINGNNRRLIANRFRVTEDTPLEILAALAANDPDHQGRQYGIVNFTGEPVTFSGTGALPAALGVTGHVGDYTYAIQGNILTGDSVVFAAEVAFRETKGDMGQRIMAAMEAARSFGGDGRCSCNPDAFDGRICGSPPPGFVKSAHVGALVIARVGDVNGPCNGTHGCAQGSYYFKRNIRGDVLDPDPVFTLQKLYDAWRSRLVGRVDGILSRVEVKGPDARGERSVKLELRDIDGNRVLRGGATIEVTTVDGQAPSTPVGRVLDLGDGRYTFTLGPTPRPGFERLLLRVSDPLPGAVVPVVTATLWPPIEAPVLGAHR